MENSNHESFNMKIVKSISDIFLTIKRKQYEYNYNIWYDHYKEHLKIIYNQSKLQIGYDIFCKYMFEGTKKHTCYRTGLKIPVLV